MTEQLSAVQAMQEACKQAALHAPSFQFTNATQEARDHTREQIVGAIAALNPADFVQSAQAAQPEKSIFDQQVSNALENIDYIDKMFSSGTKPDEITKMRVRELRYFVSDVKPAAQAALPECPTCGKALGDAGHIHTCTPRAQPIAQNEREAFEAWHKVNAHFLRLDKNELGEYIGQWTSDAWSVWQARAALPAQDNNYHDAYRGAREDLETWKKRALESEESCRKLIQMLNEENGPTHMGEPVLPAQDKDAELTELRAKLAVAETERDYLKDILRRDDNRLEIRLSLHDYHYMQVITMAEINAARKPIAFVGVRAADMFGKLQDALAMQQGSADK